MVNCQVCGRPSSIYSLCVKCDERKRQGQVRRCDECGNWSDGSSSFCPTCKWKFKERKDAMDETIGYIGRPEKEKAPEKPVEKTGGFGKGKYINMAAKSLTGGMEKTKEFTKDVYIAVKEKMPTFQKQQDAAKSSQETPDPVVNNYRNKHPSEIRTHDGHFVRSFNELILDNWFYEKQIMHEYEQSVTPPSEEWMCPDFYLPYDMNGKYIGNVIGGIYVELWGMTDDEDYRKSMEKKKKIYEKKNLKLISVYPEHIKDSSTELPKIFNKIFKDKLEYADNRNEPMRTTIDKKDQTETNKVDRRGFCIRCGEPIQLNVEKPFCGPDYHQWAKFKDPEYVEKDGKCHICGKPNDSSKKKPVCTDCYKKHIELFKQK